MPGGADRAPLLPREDKRNQSLLRVRIQPLQLPGDPFELLQGGVRVDSVLAAELEERGSVDHDGHQHLVHTTSVAIRRRLDAGFRDQETRIAPMGTTTRGQAGRKSMTTIGAVGRAK
jgi:hypothetical protein